ncbi:MerR family transcriptional regulator [Conyzicola nivalis]|uniref:MerR family transcriptional regulator n=1 Tax=Conyzicola nivalis TaxID=1477021 RepID=UPI001E349F9E|nr:MerR family transcriptional regulator [Conyzicola nivalis]
MEIGDAASFVGITPRAIRRYHEIGLLPEPERGSDDRRGYGHEEMIRLLWIRRMADAGIAVDDIRGFFVDSAAAGADGIRGSTVALLSDIVASRLEGLPEGSLRQSDLDSLLVMERIFGPLGAAVNASRYIAMATHPGLREESDRVDAAEEALDDTVAVDDPRVAAVAAERHAFERALHAVIEDSGLGKGDEALSDSWEALQAVEATAQMPYDYSPARRRCLELAEELAARESA